LGRRLFDHITDGQLKWAPMDAHFDRIFLGDKHVDLVAGPEAFKAELAAAFPDEASAIDTYLDYLRQVSKAMPGIVLGKILPDLAAGPLAKITKRKAPGFLNKPTRRVLESLTSNQELIAVLTGQWGDNGLPPAQSSFIIHALIACIIYTVVTTRSAVRRKWRKPLFR